MTNINYNIESMQAKIQSKYLIKDLDQAASLGINQNKVRISQSTQEKIKIWILALTKIRAKLEKFEALKSRLGALQSRLRQIKWNSNQLNRLGLNRIFQCSFGKDFY